MLFLYIDAVPKECFFSDKSAPFPINQRNNIKAVAGNNHRRSDFVGFSQSTIELTLDNEPLFKYRSFYK